MWEDCSRPQCPTTHELKCAWGTNPHGRWRWRTGEWKGRWERRWRAQRRGSKSIKTTTCRWHMDDVRKTHWANVRHWNECMQVRENVTCEGVFCSHRQEILNISQISFAFYRICPPIFIQTWLQQQQYCRRTFFHSAYCSLSNPICFLSVWCRRTMIPGKIFTSFSKFQGIVSVNVFWFPLGFQELLQAPMCFLRSFCFTRIRLIHWVAKSCTAIANRSLFRDSQFWLRTLWSAVIKSPNFSARGTAPPLRLLHGAPCNFRPLTDLAISVFKEVSINTVFTQIHTSRKL